MSEAPRMTHHVSDHVLSCSLPLPALLSDLPLSLHVWPYRDWQDSDPENNYECLEGLLYLPPLFLLFPPLFPLVSPCAYFLLLLSPPSSLPPLSSPVASLSTRYPMPLSTALSVTLHDCSLRPFSTNSQVSKAHTTCNIFLLCSNYRDIPFIDHWLWTM